MASERLWGARENEWEVDFQPQEPAPPEAHFCCYLPVSLHPALLGRTSAQTAQGLVTGFGGHSSKDLPFSNMLQDKNYRSICQMVWFQSDILEEWLICITSNFFHQNLNTDTSLGFLAVRRGKMVFSLSTSISGHIFLLGWVALLHGDYPVKISPISQGCLGYQGFTAWVWWLMSMSLLCLSHMFYFFSKEKF